MKTTGEPISNEEIEKILVSIYENENCNEPEYYIKFIPTEKDGYVPMIDIIDVRNNSWDTFGTEEQIEELHRMHRQGDKIQGSRYKGTNDKDRQWATIQIKSNGRIPGRNGNRA